MKTTSEHSIRVHRRHTHTINDSFHIVPIVDIRSVCERVFMHNPCTRALIWFRAFCWKSSKGHKPLCKRSNNGSIRPYAYCVTHTVSHTRLLYLPVFACDCFIQFGAYSKMRPLELNFFLLVNERVRGSERGNHHLVAIFSNDHSEILKLYKNLWYPLKLLRACTIAACQSLILHKTSSALDRNNDDTTSIRSPIYIYAISG